MRRAPRLAGHTTAHPLRNFGHAAALVATALATACIPDLPAVEDAAVSGKDAAADAPRLPDGAFADASSDANNPGSGTCGDGVIDLSAKEECDPGPSGANGCTSSCKVNCPNGFVDPSTFHCYFLSTQPQTSFNGASGRCVADTGHVVTFVSDNEWTFVTKHLGDAGAPAFWLGLQYDSSNAHGYLASNQYEPGWQPLSVCPGCYAFNNSAYDAGMFPKATLPDAGVGTCAIATSGGWYQWPCSGGAPLPALCEREPPGSYARVCDAGICISIPATYPGKEYLYGSSGATVSVANAACSALSFGPLDAGHLVTLETREEREQLWRALENPPESQSPARFWIGLSAPSDAGPDALAPWTWSDGTPDSAGKYPSVWAAGQPGLGTSGQAGCLWSQLAFDKDLAHTVSGSMAYVCQF